MLAVRTQADFVTYCSQNRVDRKRRFWVSVHVLWATGEIFVEVTDHCITRVHSFFSRHKSCSPEQRREALPLVDIADAFALARTMAQRWLRKMNRTANHAPPELDEL